MTNKFFSKNLLNWFQQHGRKNLPWQENKTPYRVWLSEIMLQQTQVNTVIPYYLRFLKSFPDIVSLAQASQDEVLHLWTGLGYYARARNLHKTAKIICNEYAGKFPDSTEVLQSLPGIGRSTAGAILSFANAQHHAILDGNVKRILARHYLIEGWTASSQTQKILWILIEKITPKQHCDDFNQALMDLGSSLCSRSKPQCPICPLNTTCKAYNKDLTKLYPNPKPKKVKPEKSTYLLMIMPEINKVLLEKRPEQGIWGGLWAFPQCKTLDDIQYWLDSNEFKRKNKMEFYPEFCHKFTHFHLNITAVKIQIKIPEVFKIHEGLNNDFIWYQPSKALKLGMPTPITKLMSQIITIDKHYKPELK